MAWAARACLMNETWASRPCHKAPATRAGLDQRQRTRARHENNYRSLDLLRDLPRAIADLSFVSKGRLALAIGGESGQSIGSRTCPRARRLSRARKETPVSKSFQEWLKEGENLYD